MISDHRRALLPLAKGPVPSKSQSLPTTLAISPLCIILDGTCRWHYLLHNNEVRNVTNQNTRQHRDKLLSDAIHSIFFYHYNIFLGQNHWHFFLAFVSRNGIETFAHLLPRTCVFRGQESKVKQGRGVDISYWWEKYEMYMGVWRTGSNIQQMRNDIFPLIRWMG